MQHSRLLAKNNSLSNTLSILVILIVFFVLGKAVYADIAPPEAPPGSTIGTDTATNVRMLSERILIDVQPHTLPTTAGISADDYLLAQVTGSFTMRNLGQQAELLKLRFPMGNPRQQSQPGLSYPLVQRFQARVNGNRVETGLLELADPTSDAIATQWSTFEVNFPADQEITIEVSYTIMPTDYMPYAGFAYVLQTGAGWRDTIGSAEIIVRLPYLATAESVQNLSMPATFKGNEVLWEFTDLEPTQEHDLFFSILVPPIWQQLTEAHAGVDANPEDADALVKLAMAYEACIPYHGIMVQNQNIATLAETSYERAIALRSNDADLYGGYAALLWKHLGYQVISDESDPAVQRVLAVVNAALTRDPQQKQALAVLEDMNTLAGKPLSLPPAYQVLTPTPQPGTVQSPIPEPGSSTPEASSVPSVASGPTPTQIPTMTPSIVQATPSTVQPSTTASPASSSPGAASFSFTSIVLLVGALLLVIGVILAFLGVHK